MSLNIRFFKLMLQAPEVPILVALGTEQINHLDDKLGLDPELIADFKHGYVDGCCGTWGGYIYLCLPKEYNPIVVAHECIHAANRAWMMAGANLLPDNDEVITYTHDAIHKMIKELYDVPTE